MQMRREFAGGESLSARTGESSHQARQYGELRWDEIQEGDGEDVPGGGGGQRTDSTEEGSHSKKSEFVIHGKLQSPVLPSPNNVNAGK
jgi:hypothetical protein